MLQINRNSTMRALALALSATVAVAGASHAQDSATSGRDPLYQAGRPPLKVRPEGDKAIIHTLADALGFVRGVGRGETTETLNRLQWFGKGAMVVGNVQVEVPKYSYAMSLHLHSAREDIQRTGGAGSAGRQVQVVSGTDAWNETRPGVDPQWAPGQASERRLKYARTPFGFTQAVLHAAPGAVKVTDAGPGAPVTVSLAIDGVTTTAALDSQYRPASITMIVRGKRVQTLYADYRDITEYGVMFPTHIVEKVDGKTVLDLAVSDARVASYMVFPRPAGAAAGG